MDDVEIDRLLDEATAESKWRKEKLENPVTKSWEEFKDGDMQPFYVIVHPDTLDLHKEHLDPEVAERVRKEIEEIEAKFPNTRAGPFQLASGVPRDRPILVCGAYDASCVWEQYELLVKAGYDAFLSKEGTLPFGSDKKPDASS